MAPFWSIWILIHLIFDPSKFWSTGVLINTKYWSKIQDGFQNAARWSSIHDEAKSRTANQRAIIAQPIGISNPKTNFLFLGNGLIKYVKFKNSLSPFSSLTLFFIFTFPFNIVRLSWIVRTNTFLCVSTCKTTVSVPI